jgi:Aspartyl protease
VSPPEKGNLSRVELTRPAENTEDPSDTDHVNGTRTVQEETSSRTESTRPAQVVKPLDTDCTKLTRPVQKSAEGQKMKEANKPPPYRPPVPFPRRLAETKLNDQFAKFVDVIKQLQITIPFTEALTQMPTYAKFLKDILSNKRSLGERETVKLTEQCSAILRSELPPKLEDPDKFSIPCSIGKATIKKALCDLGASVSLMPCTIFDRMEVGELKPTRMTLQLADSSVRLPLGIVKDVPVLVGKFYVPADFVVMEMEEDKEVPIILGRPFLRTAGAMILGRQ